MKLVPNCVNTKSTCVVLNTLLKYSQCSRQLCGYWRFIRIPMMLIALMEEATGFN